jgi:hypothetical protein
VSKSQTRNGDTLALGQTKPRGSRPRHVGSLRVAAVGCLLTFLAVLPAPLTAATGAAEDAEGPGGGETRQVAIGPTYRANGFHRWLWGTNYRPLWTTPIRAEVLNLQTFAGGLKPLFRVGGRETKGLAMKGADGRDYPFRGIDKAPTSILPEDLQDTWAKSLIQDQIAANHPRPSS